MYITKYALDKIQAYTKHAAGEVSGIAKFEQIGNTFGITDAVIVDQIATAATVDAPAAGIANFFQNNPKESPANWIVQWHSHADMATYFSQTDVENILENKNIDTKISIVVNKKKENKVRWDFFKNSLHYLTVDDSLQLIEESNEELDRLCAQEVAEKVKAPAPVVIKNNYKSYNYKKGKNYISPSSDKSSPFKVGQYVAFRMFVPVAAYSNVLGIDFKNGFYQVISSDEAITVIEDVYTLRKAEVATIDLTIDTSAYEY